MRFKKPDEYMCLRNFYPETKSLKYKIIVWKNVKTNNWECIIRERDAFDWKLGTFETKEEAINFVLSLLKPWGAEFEVSEL